MTPHQLQVLLCQLQELPWCRLQGLPWLLRELLW